MTANEPAAAVATSPSALTGGTSPQGGTDDGNPFAVPPSRVGLYMTQDHIYYVNGQGPISSVTTVLGVKHKWHLTEWWKTQTALAAMTHLPELLEVGTVEEGIKLIRSIPTEIRDRAAQLGTRVHTQSDMPLGGHESDAKGFETDPDTYPYLEAYRGFLTFLEAHRGRIISSEHAVWNKTDGYAGTYDRLIDFGCECHKGLWLVDLKTGKDLYPDHVLQLAAYGRAEYIVLPDDPTLYPMPEPDRYGCLHLRPDKYPGPFTDGWRLVEYPVTGREYVAFLAALDLYQWESEWKERVRIQKRKQKHSIENTP